MLAKKGSVRTKAVSKGLVRQIYNGNENIWIQTKQLGSYFVSQKKGEADKLLNHIGGWHVHNGKRLKGDQKAIKKVV